MNFNSIGASNSRNYAAAAKSAVDAQDKAFSIARKTGPDYAMLSKTAMDNASAEKRMAMKAEASVTQAGIRAVGNVKQTQLKTQTDLKLSKMKAKQRMAGGVAALGSIAGAGFLAFKDNTKGREYPTADTSSIYEDYKNTRDKLIQERESQRTTYKPTEFDPQDSSVSSNTGSTTSKGGTTGKESPGTASPSTNGSLSGNQKIVADAIAKYESGDWGYEAFNQGGAAGGTKVVGKSGSYKDTYGKSLTDMTLGEIFYKQNTKQRGLSMDEHIKSGGLHAVGRYQFIGSTLQDEAKRMGLSPDTKFTPQVQDAIWLNHIKRVGNISPWVGPSNNYSSSQKQQFNSMIAGF